MKEIYTHVKSTSLNRQNESTAALNLAHAIALLFGHRADEGENDEELGVLIWVLCRI